MSMQRTTVRRNGLLSAASAFLFFAAGPAFGITITAPPPDSTLTIADNGNGAFTWDYTLTNNSTTFDITDLLIPELHRGDLVVSNVGAWVAHETNEVPALFASQKPTLKSGATPKGYLRLSFDNTAAHNFDDLTTNQNIIDFFFTSDYGVATQADADFAFIFDNGARLLLDPPVPDSSSPVPVPAAAPLLMSGLGVLASSARRRARHAKRTTLK